MDELLKPVEDKESAIHLIKKKRSMCLEGGFNLIKFSSNTKRVLLSLKNSIKKAGIKNEGLLSSFPEEQTLEVSIKDKPKARIGILSILHSIYDPLGFGAPFCFRGK